MPDDLNLLAYASTAPSLAGTPRHAGAGHALIGRVSLGAGIWLAQSAVVRADGNYVRGGADLYLGPRATVHIAHDLYPTLIGECVTIGEYAVAHACEIGDGCVLEERAVVLDGAVLEPGVVLAADAVVFSRARLPGGFVYSGRPAKPERELRAGELQLRRAALRERIERAAGAPHPRFDLREPLDASVFVANTATLRGDIDAHARVNIWYGCDLDAGGGQIVIGERSNVQDNSLLACTPGGRIEIGIDSTVGHNVRMEDCSVGDRCLVGIGSVVARDTRFEDDTFLAAGAITKPGQVLTGGFLWGGQPARKLAPLDDRKKTLITETISTYCVYAEELQRVQNLARVQRL